MTIEKFTIDVSNVVLVDLRRRLDATRWPDELENVGWELGSSLSYMKSLADYWRNGYDWRRQEATLNQLPQYRVALDGFHVHFVHVRSKDPKPLPLIITHGWPGSFIEMVKLIPLLTDPAAHGGRPEDAFDVIVPSLPGYGFSDRPTERGMNPFKVAALWARLMTESVMSASPRREAIGDLPFRRPLVSTMPSASSAFTSTTLPAAFFSAAR